MSNKIFIVYCPWLKVVQNQKALLKRLQTQINSKFTANQITAGDRDRTFVTSHIPHGNVPCGLTFNFGPISDPLSYDKGYSYLLNKTIIVCKYEDITIVQNPTYSAA